MLDLRKRNAGNSSGDALLISSGGGVGRLLFLDILELVHHDIPLGEVGNDPQFSPQGFHEATQGMGMTKSKSSLNR
jgi:hypothetical protein